MNQVQEQQALHYRKLQPRTPWMAVARDWLHFSPGSVYKQARIQVGSGNTRKWVDVKGPVNEGDRRFQLNAGSEYEFHGHGGWPLLNELLADVRSGDDPPTRLTVKVGGKFYDWCSAFVNHCLTAAGYQGLGTSPCSTGAVFWSRHHQVWGGVRVWPPRYGCVMVFRDRHSVGQGHVGFCDLPVPSFPNRRNTYRHFGRQRFPAWSYYVLGGNQGGAGGRVTIEWVPKPGSSRLILIDCMWPTRDLLKHHHQKAGALWGHASTG